MAQVNPNTTAKLHKRQGGKCYYCKVETFLAKTKAAKRWKMQAATFDHIIPKGQGGGNSIHNGVCACRRCNSVRGQIPFEQWKVMATSPKAVLAIVRERKERCKRIRMIKNTFKVHRLISKLIKYYVRGHHKKPNIKFVPYLFH